MLDHVGRSDVKTEESLESDIPVDFLVQIDSPTSIIKCGFFKIEDLGFTYETQGQC
jgi:hypothetical protein